MSTPTISRPQVSADDFRAVFRRYAASVVVVTMDGPAGPVGFTATSLASVSLDPPMVSFALARVASTWPALRRARSVAVNFLAEDQHWLARRFATSGIDRFDGTGWHRLGTGEPVLDAAPLCLQAELDRRLAVGDHQLVIATVTNVDSRRDHTPLLYHQGQYVGVGEPGTPVTAGPHSPLPLGITTRSSR